MVVNATKLKQRISQDQDFFTKAKEGLKPELRKLKSQGLSNEAIKKQLRARLQGQLGAEGSKVFSSAFREQQGTTIPTKRVDLFAEKTVIDPATGQPELRKTTATTPVGKTGGIEDISSTDITGTEGLDDTTVGTDGLTLKQRVAAQVAGKKTREESLKDIRGEEGRADLLEQRKGFREEISSTQEDLVNIRKGLEQEGGAITKIAASRIREARSQPLRDVLSGLTKGLEVTSDNLEELDTSIDAILEARTLDGEDAANNLAAQIEASSLSDVEKSQLIAQLGVETNAAKRRDELEIFRQKEEIKADIKKKEDDSLTQTGLTLGQNVTLGKIVNNFDVKEDSLIAKSVANMLKEGKSEQEINKILGLATDAEGNFVDDTQFARREKLRKEFEAKAGVKAYRESVLQHQGTIATLGQASGPGDVAAVFQFMKTLDPTSVVRESEFRTAAESAGVLEQYNAGNVFEKFKNGAILGDADSRTREAFVKTVNELFRIKKQNYDGIARSMIQQAIRDGVDPKSVVLDLDEVTGASDLTRDDFNLLNDDDLLEIDKEFGFTSSDGTSFNLDFNIGETTSLTNIGLGTVTQKFGDTSPLSVDNVRLANGSVGTPGIDIDGKIGDPIPATVSGTVKIIASNTGLGNRVVIVDEEGNEHFFNHLDGFNVEDGQTITKGQQIGTMGNSGSVIAGPGGDGSHLDYRVKSSQGWIDPNKFLIS